MQEAVLQTKQTELEQHAPPTALPVQPERVPVGDVLRQIRQDAARDPQAYLKETLVPRGGE
jgi:hypothetical protein